MKIDVLSKQSNSEYESFLLSQPGTLFYHTTKYKDFLEDLLGCKSHYLLARDTSNQIIAALPLMIKAGSYGTVINSLPYYGSNGGIIGESNNTTAIQLFKETLAEMDYSALTLISSPHQDNISSLQDTFTDQRISQMTYFKPESLNYDEYIFSIIDSSTRRNIKKAKSVGFQVVVKNQQAIPFLETIHNENMTVINGKAKSHNFFSKISDHFEANHDYKIYVAELGRNPVAALLVFFYNGTVEYFTPVIKHEHRDQQPLAIILFEAMKDALNLGYHSWNWGGTWLSQKGVYQFKKKWGAVENIYHYSTHIVDKSILTADRHSLLNEYEGFYIYNFIKEALNAEK